MTRLTRPKQALMLYNNLTGRAWRDAEELELGLLDSEQGVEVFVDWIKSRYMDREVTKIGRYMSDFVKVLKRNTQQDIRDFKQEFDRQVSRLKEVGRLPRLVVCRQDAHGQYVGVELVVVCRQLLHPEQASRRCDHTRSYEPENVGKETRRGPTLRGQEKRRQKETPSSDDLHR